MAFSWQQNINAESSIDNEDINEIQTNLDTIYTFLGITRTECASGAGWTELPVSGGETPPASFIESTQIQQLRDVADYADDNWCASYDASVNSTVYSTHNPTNLAIHNTTYNSGDESSVNSSADSLYKSLHYVSNNSTHEATYKNINDSGFNATY
ncbi:MAG: hypothetical protein WC242_05305 [Candidatus Paceibacterota bacterium]|jgi:hypothetical protein